MPWFAVHCRPMHEGAADQDLRRLGVVTFYPRSRVRRHVRRGHALVPRWSTRPYYPGWLFVEADVRRLHLVAATRGVCCLGSLGGQPAAIPAAVMVALMAGANSAGIMDAQDDTARRRFRERAIVEFLGDSPLAGMLAKVVCDTGELHMRVSINIFGGNREISVPANSVQLAAVA